MYLTGKKILLGVTGSIAAYKSILLLRLLVKQGAEVRVIMTGAAKDFVSPLVLATLSRNPVVSGLFEDDAWSNHVMLGRWADIMVIAPLTCNTLSKMATGACDNLLTAVYLSAVCPVLVSPAMDEDMWKHPSTVRNLSVVEKDGVHIMPVGYGELGSGLTGEGRMAEPEEIVERIKSLVTYPSTPLKGKIALVTAGPTYEPIDPVRYIGNRSSGKMGVAIAAQLQRAGATVNLLLGPSSQQVPHGISVQRVETAQQMFDKAIQLFPDCHIGVFSAAVADFKPEITYSEKWKKGEKTVPDPISFTENPDILKYCGVHKKPEQVVAGFALETQNEELNALNKLHSKNADLLVLNSLRDEGAGFGGDSNKITIFRADGTKTALPLQSKEETAVHIVQAIINTPK